ncbi:MAG: NAD(P)/FAD-dependent oxidoreductase, partial [Eubacterium sp.]|nr:NAD(P)/FAD-dependent oxidoreductase [Eubacterium sp.]
MSTIIIGAGASGLAAAIALKLNLPNEKVILLERLPSAGKKILAPGNG